MLLDIVARSLYSENEVFVREIISNSSDALEKLRYLCNTDAENLTKADKKFEIHIETNKQERTLIFQDTGIGMTREELVENLGTIARSGSKKFIQQIQDSGNGANANASNIIGQFGVGFYSVFMCADKIDLYSKSSFNDSIGYKWSSDGAGKFTIQESKNVSPGTKIVIHLKPECREYAEEDRIREIIKKYSNFVGNPIFLNGQQVNSIQPIWLMDPKQISKEDHNEFYRYVGNTFDTPRFVLHYKTEAPISIRALLYFSEGKHTLFDMNSSQTDFGISLYCKKILIQSKSEMLLPRWLRFVKGVVDSEDIPLNLSRELLQNSSLIYKLQRVLTARVIKFLLEKSKKDAENYMKFYADYGTFLKEGIVTSTDQNEKEDIAKLLLFESSNLENGKVSLEDYVKKAKENQKDIYYLAAPNRSLALSSPYYESLQKSQNEVIFCYEPYDELVLMQLVQYKGFNLTSVEKEMRRTDAEDTNKPETEVEEGSLTKQNLEDLVKFIKTNLSGKVKDVKITTKLNKHPVAVTVEEMAAARHFIKTQGHSLTEENRYSLLQPQFEVNPKYDPTHFPIFFIF